MGIPAHTIAPPATARKRIDSIDLLRGLVMIIMALDHVRDFFHADGQLYSPDDLSRTTAFLFFTRWITHFCAPTFVFLAGVSIHFSAPRRATLSFVSRFLITRGLWLIFLEWTVMQLGFSFNLTYRITLIQVIWATGWSMVAMAGLIWLPRKAILAVALGMIAVHNAFDGVKPAAFGPLGWLWSILHVPTMYQSGERHFFFLYPLIPWIGVMAAGYCFGPVMQLDPTQRRRTLVRIGTALTAAFLLLRFANVYGDPQKWLPQLHPVMTVLSFLKVTKYPPSLLFLLMTLGPAILLLAVLDRVVVEPHNFFRVFGRVPMFYYILHFYSIHALAVVLGGLVYGRWGFFFQFPSGMIGVPAPGFPEHYGFSLAIVYLIWASLVVALYFPCRWYMDFKNRNNSVWLSYL